MASIGEQVLAHFASLLDGAGKPAGLTVHRSRGRPLDQDDLPAVVVYPLVLDPEDADHDEAVEEGLDWAVECRAKQIADASADEALDPLIVWVRKTVWGDREAGGLAMDTVSIRRGEQGGGIRWAPPQEIGELYGAVRIPFRTTYYTSASDPEQSA